MKFFRSKWVLFLALPMLLGLGYYFHKPLVCYIIKKRLCRYEPYLKNSKVSYKSLVFKDRAFEVRDLCVKDKDALEGEQKESEDLVHIKKLKCHLMLKAFPMKLKFFISVDCPHFFLTKRNRNTKSKELRLYRFLASFKGLRKLQVENGSIDLLDEERNLLTHASFSYTPSALPGKVGAVALKLDEEKNTIKASLSIKNQRAYLDINYENIALKEVENIARFFSKEQGVDYSVSQGFLQGHLNIEVAKDNTLRKFKSDFKAFNVALHKATAELNFTSDFIHVTSLLPEGKKLPLKKLHLAVLTKELITSYEMGKGHFTYMNPSTGVNWKLLDITGKASFNHQTMPNLYFTANMQKDEECYPLALAGKGWIDTEKSYWMDFDLSMLPENKQGKHTSFYVALLGEGHYFVKSSLSSLEKEQLSIFQDVFVSSFPRLANLDIKEGKVSCDFSLEIKEKVIESIALEHINCKNLKASFEDVVSLNSLGELRGKLKLYYPLLSPVKAHSCDLYMKDADVALKVNDKPYCFDKTNFEISSRNFKVDKGKISTVHEGVRSHFAISGPFAALDICAQFDFDNEHLLSSLQEDVLAYAKTISKLQSSKLEMKLKFLEDRINLVGSSIFSYENGISDNIGFGIKFNKAENLSSIFHPMFWKNSLNRGWFKSEKISENTYLWVVSPFKQKWYTLGDMQVKGKFDLSTLSFLLKSKKAYYDSEDIIVNLNSETKFNEGSFNLDIASESWDIEIPLSGAKCVDKKYNIPFEDVSCLLKINGTNLSCERIKGTSENVAFEGRLDLDFKNLDWLDLKIYPSRIEGDAQDFMRFLRYLPDFKDFDYPLQGRVKSVFENKVFTKYNETDSVKSTKLYLEVEDASYNVTDSLSLKDASCAIYFDSDKDFLEIKDLKAETVMEKGNDKRSYHLESRYLHANKFLEGKWEFDVRVEAPTYDVLRLAGTTEKSGEDFKFNFEKDLSHFFGAKFNMNVCAFNEDFLLKNIHIKSDFSSVDLFNQIQCLYLSDFLDMKPSLFEDLKNTKTEGDIALELSYDREQQGFQIDVESRALLFDRLLIEDLSINACKNRHHFVLQKFKTKEFSAIAVAEKKEVDWRIPVFEMHYKDSFFTTTNGVYKKDTSTLHLELDKVKLVLAEMLDFKESAGFNLLEGTLEGQGNIAVDFSNGVKNAAAQSEFTLHSDNFTSAKCKLDTKVPLKVAFSADEGIVFENIKIGVKNDESDHNYCNIDAKHFQAFPFTKAVTGKSIKLSLPPEMLHFLAKNECFPSVEVKDDQLIAFGKEFSWDNQIETELDFSYEKDQLSLSGLLKEGYYWMGDKSVFLQKIRYVYGAEKLNVAFGLDYQNASVDVVAKLQLDDEVKGAIVVKEGHKDDHDDRTGVQLLCRYNQEDGFFVQSVDGEIYGLEFALQRNPRSYVPHVMILTGQMKIDTFALVKAFPELFYNTFKELGMGSGYELSGDWVFSKKDLLSSNFKGFLKGRDFEFLGYYFKTLLSEVEVNSKSITVHDFSLSDKSGVFQMKEVKIAKKEDDTWQMNIPEVTIQDFRPSFLKKNHGQEEQIKPFMIKDMHFFNIQGTLNDKESFTGRGYLDFINTFKRDYNLLDIPIEIIGRIGFDLGLFIPVRGKLEFDMVDGKIFLKELQNTFSEGKRSRFYLSGYKDSYIDLDGTIFIDIKMKQYVLLKITEPFTLSIRGSLDKPKYSLR
ncbi:MAG: hypothetical protein S4CHLAM37_02250 [Chlamydiia bacterium]|nr:hypothetical protein [Chlamydiia bacterium]